MQRPYCLIICSYIIDESNCLTLSSCQIMTVTKRIVDEKVKNGTAKQLMP